MSERVKKLEELGQKAASLGVELEALKSLFRDFSYSFAATQSAVRTLTRQLADFVEVAGEVDCLVEKHGMPGVDTPPDGG